VYCVIKTLLHEHCIKTVFEFLLVCIVYPELSCVLLWYVSFTNKNEWKSCLFCSWWDVVWHHMFTIEQERNAVKHFSSDQLHDWKKHSNACNLRWRWMGFVGVSWACMIDWFSLDAIYIAVIVRQLSGRCTCINQCNSCNLMCSFCPVRNCGIFMCKLYYVFGVRKWDG